MRKVTGWMMAGSLALVAAVSLAQERRDPAAPAREPARDPAAARAPARPGPAAQFSRGDQEIAATLLAMCHNEVELAKLAQQKATSEDVRMFAEKMIKEHTTACENLEQVAGPLAAKGHAAPGGLDRPGLPARPGARPAPDAEIRIEPAPGAPAAPAVPGGAARDPEAPAAPGARPGVDVTVRGPAPAAGGLNWVSIHQEMAAQCLASAKQEFAKKEGEEFDKCYIGGAIASHQHAIDADRVFLKHASPAFQGEIENGLKMATGHLNMAKEIMQKLDGKAPRLSARPDAPRTGTEPPRRNPDEARPNPDAPPRRPQ